MAAQPQRELLEQIKAACGGTWEDVAYLTRIKPRTLKSYRLPPDSAGYRGMDLFVRESTEKILAELLKQHR